MPLNRRKFLTNAGIAGGGLAIGGIGGFIAGQDDADAAAATGTGSVPFYGKHQAGIVTPQQDRLHFASFDVITNDKQQLRDMLIAWSAAAARMTQGETAAPDATSDFAPPTDTGEATGLAASRLTVTVGFGPTLFRQRGRDRFGLASQMPKALAPLPALPADDLHEQISNGDICVQACSDDPQAAFHAVRNLARIGRGTVVMRWSQLGFGRTSSTSSSQQTPRNLLGFKDGTNNIKGEEGEKVLNEHVWVQPGDGPDWLVGGSYAVTRRIRMLIEVWDRNSLADQEDTIGRKKVSGAPQTGLREHDKPNYDAKTADGKPLIPNDSHIRNAAPENNKGIRLLRRGYSFTDGFDPQLGQLDAGLFFIAYQRNAHEQFVPIQRRLGSIDALNEYIIHRSSALFAVPPGVPNAKGRYLGDQLFS
ncbi:MAG: iron uptake transporter deferrochelatase/peroxidase subunit [Solirubrobacterales bacterium]